MTLIRIPPSWQLPERAVTPETAYVNRRQVLKAIVGAGLGITGLPAITGCQQGVLSQTVDNPQLAATLPTTPIEAYTVNPQFAAVDRPMTDRDLAGQYNNYYEFGSGKFVWQAAQRLPTEPWSVEVTGLVKHPRTYTLEELLHRFPLEERVYRFRCVEAWSMVLPWVGFPMRTLLAQVEPTAAAKFVRFTSFYDPQWMGGLFSSFYPWPYTEGLRIEEMSHELAFFAVGLYGKLLPKQQGAPIRMVLPWKYGFKGAKAIVKIEFVETEPKTFWHTVQPNEYGFLANVEPEVPHPRWSQRTERFISTGPGLSWEERPTLLYNGYADWVAGLYAA
ncbi:protein-methionine-sulfoxide reductase catalytic subunit MsrP [Trichothermofontia sp.]